MAEQPRVAIRPLRLADGPQLLRFYRNPQVANLFFRSGRPSRMIELFARFPFLRTLTGQIAYAIVDQANDRLIGEISFWGISRDTGTAGLSICIGEPAYWGKGYGTEALRLALREAFTTHGLRKVNLEVYSFNPRAIRSYEKHGFVQEGRRREVVLRNDRYEDAVLMGILAQEFLDRETATAAGATTAG